MSTKQFIKIINSLFLLSFLTWTYAVQAHGGGDIVLSKVPVGACEMTVWLAPAGTISTRDTLHVTVGLTHEDEFALDESVQLEVMEGEEQVLQTAVSPENASLKLYYEVDFTLPKGNYTFHIQTNGPLCQGKTTLPVTVETSANNQWLISIPAILFILSIIYLWQRRSSAVPETMPKPSRKP